MSRNGSGTYTIPNTMVSGTTITASGHNENYDDIGVEITNSVAADGQTTLTGALKLANGSLAAPALTFGADSDTGIYRVAADTFGVAVAGQNVVSITTATAAFSGVITQGGGLLVPTGGIMIWPMNVAPAGWSLCQGAALSRTGNAALFAVIGVTYGSGDGSTTFNVPDLLGRVVAGITGSSGRLAGFDFVGTTGGAQNVTLFQGNLPNVAFSVSGTCSGTITVGTQTPVVPNSTSVSTSVQAFGSGSPQAVYLTDKFASIDAFSGSISGSAASGGSGSPLSNVQPTMAMNYIIKL